jgi:hypothetical protein
MSSPRHSRPKQLIPASIQLAWLAALIDVWYFRVGAETWFDWNEFLYQFCTADPAEWPF